MTIRRGQKREPFSVSERMDCVPRRMPGVSQPEGVEKSERIVSNVQTAKNRLGILLSCVVLGASLVSGHFTVFDSIPG